MSLSLSVSVYISQDLAAGVLLCLVPSSFIHIYIYISIDACMHVCVLAPLLSFLHAVLCTNDDMLIIIFTVSIYLYLSLSFK